MKRNFPESGDYCSNLSLRLTEWVHERQSESRYEIWQSRESAATLLRRCVRGSPGNWNMHCQPKAPRCRYRPKFRIWSTATDALLYSCLRLCIWNRDRHTDSKLLVSSGDGGVDGVTDRQASVWTGSLEDGRKDGRTVWHTTRDRNIETDKETQNVDVGDRRHCVYYKKT